MEKRATKKVKIKSSVVLGKSRYLGPVRFTVDRSQHSFLVPLVIAVSRPSIAAESLKSGLVVLEEARRLADFSQKSIRF